MINERDGNAGFLTVALYERNFGSEVTGDFTLPDYNAEIRRILNVTPTVLPPSKYVSDNSVEFNGVVDYLVTYVGADGEMYSVPLSSDYSFNVPLDKGEYADTCDDVAVLCSIGVESANTRVSAPRRLSVRCRIRPNVRVYARIPTAVSCDSEVNVAGIYTHSQKAESLVCESATSDVITVTSIFSSPSDDTRVVKAESYVNITSHEPSPSGISCRGSVEIKLLVCKDESGAYETITGSVPFDGEIDLEKGLGDGGVRLGGIPAEMSVNITDTGIECSVGVIVEATVCRNSQMEYTDDIYSTQHECDLTLRRSNVKRLAGSMGGSFTVSERIPLADAKLSEGAEIIDVCATASMDKCAVENGKCVLGGVASFNVIYRKDGEIFSSDVPVDIRYSGDCNADGALSFDCHCEPMKIAAKLDGGNLCIDAEMAITADIVSENAVSTVRKVNFGEEIPRPESQLVVCYPTASDTVWSVAKRYKVPVSSVSGDPATDRFVIIE